MIGDPVCAFLEGHRVRAVRDKKIEMLADWEETNQMPGKVIVRRDYDFEHDREVTIITVRSAIPRHMRWNP